MPTFNVFDTFWKDWRNLSPERQKIFLAAVKQFYRDLQGGTGFRAGLRVKMVQGHPHIWEMTWANDGRATFTFGDEVVAGHRHIIWRRIGTHDILKRP